MSNAPQKNSPMLKAAGLWAKSSTKGGQYFTGRLGGVKVLILENRDRKSDADPSHNLFFVEAPDRRQSAGERPQERSGGAGGYQPTPAPQNASGERRGGSYGYGQRVPDHQAPLDYEDAPEWAR